MFSVRLERIRSNHNNYRTSVIDGWCDDLPEIGRIFTMTAPALEKGDLRAAWTTEVLSLVDLIKGNDFGQIQFTTKNSIYELHYGKKIDL